METVFELNVSSPFGIFRKKENITTISKDIDMQRESRSNE